MDVFIHSNGNGIQKRKFREIESKAFAEQQKSADAEAKGTPRKKSRIGEHPMADRTREKDQLTMLHRNGHAEVSEQVSKGKEKIEDEEEENQPTLLYTEDPLG